MAHRRVVVRELFDLTEIGAGTTHHRLELPVDAQVVGVVENDGFLKLVTVESKGPAGSMAMIVWIMTQLEEVGGGVTPLGVVSFGSNIYSIFGRNE